MTPTGFVVFVVFVFVCIAVAAGIHLIWLILDWLFEEDGLDTIKGVMPMNDESRVPIILSLVAISMCFSLLVGRCGETRHASPPAPTATATPYPTVEGEMVRLVVPGKEEGQVLREYTCVKVYAGSDYQALIDCATPTPSIPVSGTVKLGQ